MNLPQTPFVIPPLARTVVIARIRIYFQAILRFLKMFMPVYYIKKRTKEKCLVNFPDRIKPGILVVLKKNVKTHN